MMFNFGKGKRPPRDSALPDDEYADVVFGHDKNLDRNPDRDYLREMVRSFDGKSIPRYMHERESQKDQNCQKLLPKVRLFEDKRTWSTIGYYRYRADSIEQYCRWYDEQQQLPRRGYLEAGEKECSRYVQHLKKNNKPTTIEQHARAMRRVGVKGMQEDSTVSQQVRAEDEEYRKHLKYKNEHEQSGGQVRSRMSSESLRERPVYREIPANSPESGKIAEEKLLPQQSQSPSQPPSWILEDIAKFRKTISQKMSRMDELDSEIDKLEREIAELSDTMSSKKFMRDDLNSEIDKLECEIASLKEAQPTQVR